MTEPWILIDGPPSSPFLLIADHASAHVPDGIDLGVPAESMAKHVALDIGVEALAQALCAQLSCPAVLGGVSRLVVDFNREEDAPHNIPRESDGLAIPGNALDEAGKQSRIDRYWRPYHARIDAQMALQKPLLLISLHSFTPQLETRPEEARPWQIGILYNKDDRAARVAIPLLAAQGLSVGDQLPYSGKALNATMNRHGEAKGIAYLGIEMRQDQITDAQGVARWAAILAPIVRACLPG